ncbi:unnamed protein product [Cercospora beticola]|nr:unnamed protein product [Cercospora beticola]
MRYVGGFLALITWRSVDTSPEMSTDVIVGTGFGMLPQEHLLVRTEYRPMDSASCRELMPTRKPKRSWNKPWSDIDQDRTSQIFRFSEKVDKRLKLPIPTSAAVSSHLDRKWQAKPQIQVFR